LSRASAAQLPILKIFDLFSKLRFHILLSILFSGEFRTGLPLHIPRFLTVMELFRTIPLLHRKYNHDGLIGSHDTWHAVSHNFRQLATRRVHDFREKWMILSEILKFSMYLAF
jgi:hypothetical protein